jgi:hypothetical protein
MHSGVATSKLAADGKHKKKQGQLQETLEQVMLVKKMT